MDRDTVIRVEQTLNILMGEEPIERRRTAAAAYLREHIGAVADERLKGLGLGKREFTALANAEKPLFAQINRRLEEAGISREKRSELRTVACAGPEAAEKQLRMLIYDQEMSKVFKRSGLGHTSWRAFIESSGYVTRDTAERIADAAGLDEKKRPVFLGLLVRDSFEDLTRLRPMLWGLMVENSVSESELRRRTLLSPRAWAPLARSGGDGGKEVEEDLNGVGEDPGQENSGKKAAADRVSQSTLLRLAVGLELDRPDSEKLLDSVGSGFIMRRDLVVLAAIILGIYDSWDVYDILEEYARGPMGVRYFGNIYQTRIVVG